VIKVFRPALLLLLLLTLCSCKVTAYSDLSEQEVNEMLVALSNNGISAFKTSVGQGLWELSVEERYLPRGLDILNANGLPRTKFQSMGDVFKKESMVSTPLEEQARLVFALSQELAATVAAIDGVLDARVHLVLPELDNFGKKLSPSTAAVFVKHRSDMDLSTEVTQIKHLVSNSVRDLKYESISVYLFASIATPPSPVLPEASVFGISVDPSNETLARIAVFAALVALLAALAFGALRLLRRKNPAAREQ
jgi:type III secretion protein J